MLAPGGLEELSQLSNNTKKNQRNNVWADVLHELHILT